MTPTRVPWSGVVPWSEVLGPDGWPWTVLPSWPPTVKRLTRAGMPVATITPNPYTLVTVLVPDERDAIALLTRELGAELIADSTNGQPWRVPSSLVLDRDRMRLHMRDFHGVDGLGLHGYRHPDEQARHHYGLHIQQRVPLPVVHWHSED